MIVESRPKIVGIEWGKPGWNFQRILNGMGGVDFSILNGNVIERPVVVGPCFLSEGACAGEYEEEVYECGNWVVSIDA